MANKTQGMRLKEFERGKPFEEIIREQIERGESWTAIAEDLGVSRLTLRDWVSRIGARAVVQRRLVLADSDESQG
jgi:DNA invertase Pin-like site-specific DNA recombinase